MPSTIKKIKFHGQEVENVVIRYSQKMRDKPDATAMEEFDAAESSEICESINVQVVSDFVTITYYKDEKANSVERRELIPVHRVEHIWIKDLQT